MPSTLVVKNGFVNPVKVESESCCIELCCSANCDAPDSRLEDSPALKTLMSIVLSLFGACFIRMWIS